MKTLARVLPILFLVCFCLVQGSYSQSKYGNATMDEMNMEVYAKDTAAVAVVLLKKGETRFIYSSLNGFQFEFTLQMKVKILKNEGLDWCNQEISYYQESSSWKEDVRGLSGTTYNLENGKITKTKLSKDFIFDEETDKKWKVKKFTMPAAKVGSVIEYKYTMVSDFFHELREFTFQSSAPILYASYEILIPEYFRYNVDTQGYLRLVSKRENSHESFPVPHHDAAGNYQNNLRCSAEKFKFEAKDVDGIKNESFLWNIHDFISKVSFELKNIQMPYSMVKSFSSSWSNIDKEIMESGSFGGNLKRANLFKDEISKTELTLERAGEIQDIIKSKVKWNDKNAISPTNLKDALKNGIGNSADVNFLLINALKAGGFNAFPIILSTRTNGRIPITHPSMLAFNYVITGVQIDTTMYFTDAAAKYGNWNLLPEKCLVPQARILKPDYAGWVDLTSVSNGSILKVINYKFSDSKLIGQVTDTRRGNAAYNSRSNYYGHKDRKDYIESLSKGLSCEIDNFKISNLDNTSEALKLEYTQSTDMSLGEDFLYINPLSDKLFTENPFKEETRKFPIQFNYLLNYVQIINIEIPEGYVVDELPTPEKMILNDNDITFTYRIQKSENLVRVHYQYQLKKIQFLPNEYEYLKDFYAKIVLKNNEQIVLKKAAAVSTE